MPGSRVDYTDNTIPQPGEYGKDSIGNWYAAPPTPADEAGFIFIANLSGHSVVEHEDRTISVSPSILITQGRRGRQWHGYLERGVWREV